MALRPSAAQWFEIVVPRDDAHDAMEALARSSDVQFEWSGEQGTGGRLEHLREPVSRFRALAKEYGRYWPEPLFEQRCCEIPVEAAAETALEQIERWRAAAEPLLDQMRSLQAQAGALERWRPVLASMRGSVLELGSLSRAGPVLTGFCLLIPEASELPDTDGALVVESRFDGHRACLGLLPRDDFPFLRDEARARDAVCLRIPDGFSGTADRCIDSLPERLREIEREVRHQEQELRRMADDLAIDQARGVMGRIDWFLRTARDIDCDSGYCWITGWTGEQETSVLNRALREVGVESSVELVDPPQDASPPSVTRYPRWLRPFEVFTHAVGVPGLREADPTTWVALLVPLMFGYMCGDVGHGALIVVTGFLLRGRTDLWPLFVFCGIASAGFGFAYGDVFGFEHLIDPLWVRPLEEPFLLLVVPVAAGALVLSLGVLLHLIETCWRGFGPSQGVADAAQLLVYWGLILAFVDLRFGWLVLVGASLCIGNRLWNQSSLKALLVGIGQQAESTFTLLLNTLSFARVGAFALAHAALESAVLTLADGVSNALVAVLILITGNLIVVLVEGLVVGIQTTRLVLFEFFVRFFEGRGRRFRPVPLPPAADRPRRRR